MANTPITNTKKQTLVIKSGDNEESADTKFDVTSSLNLKTDVNSSDVTSNVTEVAQADESPATETVLKRIWSKWCKIYGSYSFLILVAGAICLARAYPPLGAKYLAPQITATWVAVVIIFVLSGLGLRTDEFVKAFQRLKFNIFVQVFNFGFVSAVVFGFSRLMTSIGVLSQTSANGMVICSCMPITINMVLVLTKSSSGDEAAAVFNAAFANMTGVFISPALILLYLGVEADIDLGKVFFKIGLRVILPTFIGQVLQKFSPQVVEFKKKYKKHFKTIQEYCLIFIVYTVFCRTFDEGLDSSADAKDVFIMLALQFVLLCSFMVTAWFLLKIVCSNNPKLRVMGLFGCTHKSVAIGVPLINAIFDGNPQVGFYTLPLLIWHPMQLVIGSFLAPRLAAFVERKEKNLSCTSDKFDDDKNSHK